MLNDRALAAEIGGRFDHILVDEYQDTNRLQAEILLKLKPDGRGVMVVGDDAQAIYSFRAATVRNILEFPGKFKPPACVLKLEQNYRSTRPILDACNKVMEFAKKRFTKNLFSERRSQQKPYLTTVADEAAQARYVAQRLLKARESGISLKHQAVLFRASHHSNQLEIELARRNIPFVKYGGVKFLEAAHVKDVVSVLRWCNNPRDRVAGFRVLRLLPGIGPSTAAKILDKMAAERKVVDVLKAFVVPKKTAEDWPAFVTLIDRLRKAKNWPGEFELLRAWYEPHSHRLYEDGDARAQDIAQLQQIAAGYASRERFLTELTLDPPDATSRHARATQLDEDYTILSTIHSAKGGEWEIVRVLNVVDGCIPLARATGTADEIEEERRLLHVAMTRSKDELDLIVPDRLFMYQQNGHDSGHAYAKMSRFIPESIHHAFELKQWRERRRNLTATEPKSPSRRIDVAASAERMWRQKPEG
jgi:DNA helicase II / ATP-dependent DNA helicase PcrA